jgi:hypothetical protein
LTPFWLLNGSECFKGTCESTWCQNPEHHHQHLHWGKNAGFLIMEKFGTGSTKNFSNFSVVEIDLSFRGTYSFHHQGLLLLERTLLSRLCRSYWPLVTMSLEDIHPTCVSSWRATWWTHLCGHRHSPSCLGSSTCGGTGSNKFTDRAVYNMSPLQYAALQTKSRLQCQQAFVFCFSQAFIIY